jgi:spore maturation protein CgeB
LARRADTTFVGTPWAAHPGFAATGDLREVVAGLPAKPDLYLHVDSGATWYFPRGLTHLDCPTACYLIDVHVWPKERLKQAMFFDYAFTAQLDFVSVLRSAGHPQAHWLPLACDPEIHCRYDVPKRFDVGFVGATGAPYVRRTALLARLACRYTMNDYRRTYTPSEMARVYSASRLVFNCSLRAEVNMRVFEGPATGTLLLTDRIGNGLSELVVDREHVVMYDDEQLVDLADEFLRDAAARERIACQGYAHVRAHHTYDQRVRTILDVIFDRASGPRLCAPLRRCSNAAVQLAYAELFSRVGRVDDTIAQLHNGPSHGRYRIAAAKQILFCLLRRIKYG